ncbi:unnamed protein product [Linum trigynum]|uniref:Reverse transcriptase Ty1/copia-type domain-containing protein n=1 Tax=Linum trigynum TaxID=586398 RepID=A0AAV2CLH0_9ROSI
MKRGRPVGSKDKNPRKRKGAMNQDDHIEDMKAQEETPSITKIVVPEEHQVPEVFDNEEISNNYVLDEKCWNRSEIIVDDVFAYTAALSVMNENEDHEPRSIDECKTRDDWPKWKEAIKAELKSLSKRKVFGPIVLTPENVKPVGYNLVFVRKRNKKGEVVRYKERLVAQVFSHRSDIDYEETYSPVVDATTFRYLISLAVREGLDLRLMDVVTTYLYGSLENYIYIYETS